MIVLMKKPALNLPIIYLLFGLLIIGTASTKVYLDKTNQISTLDLELKKYKENAISLQNEVEKKESSISALLDEKTKLSELEANKELSLVKNTLQKVKEIKEKSDKYKAQGVKVEAYASAYPSILDKLSLYKFKEASSSADDINKLLDESYQAKLEADRKALEEAKKKFESVIAGSGYTRYNVVTEVGVFSADIVSADLNNVRVMTDSGVNSECKSDCTLMSVGSYVQRLGGFAGVNGSYFCPADYAQCGDKKGSFDFPIYNSRLGKWINKDNLFWDNRALIAFKGGSGSMHTYAKSFDKGSSVDAAITMTPGLLKDGNVIVGSYKLDSKEKIRSTRSSIGFGGNKVFLIVARGVTNFELAYVHKAVGSKNALALDGGGSVGMYYNNSYTAGPGRAPANAVILKNR